MDTAAFLPDFATLNIPMDAWSQPFWDAAAAHTLRVPRCIACGTFRWPAGPFCPACRSQPVDWVPPGRGSIYSFTIIPVRGRDPAHPLWRIPVLVEFDAAPGIRLVSTLIRAPLERVRIGAAVEVEWLVAANAVVPVFQLTEPDT
jgi:uncharacterized protein